MGREESLGTSRGVSLGCSTGPQKVWSGSTKVGGRRSCRDVGTRWLGFGFGGVGDPSLRPH